MTMEKDHLQFQFITNPFNKYILSQLKSSEQAHDKPDDKAKERFSAKCDNLQRSKRQKMSKKRTLFQSNNEAITHEKRIVQRRTNQRQRLQTNSKKLQNYFSCSILEKDMNPIKDVAQSNQKVERSKNKNRKPEIPQKEVLKRLKDLESASINKKPMKYSAAKKKRKQNFQVNGRDSLQIEQKKLQNRNSMPEEIFRQIDRNKGKQQELKKIKRTNHNCFYNKLKKKLQNQITKINDIKERDKINFVVEGCNMKKHTRTISLNDKRKDFSSQSRTGLEVSRSPDSRKKMTRPQTCRNRVIEKRQIDYAINEHKENHQRQYYSSTDRPKSCRNRSQRISYTKKDLTKELKVYSQKSHRQLSSKQYTSSPNNSAKQKLTQIIFDCKMQDVQNEYLTQEMKIFEFYCKKLDTGFTKRKKLLQEITKEQIDEDQV